MKPRPDLKVSADNLRRLQGGPEKGGPNGGLDISLAKPYHGVLESRERYML